MDIVDAHCHIISTDLNRYPRAPLGGKQSDWVGSRPVTAAEMVAAMDASGISQSVLVQATTAYGYDNSYVLYSSRQQPERFIAVGTFDPLRTGAAQRLAISVTEDGLAGVRLFTTGSTLPSQGEWFAAPETYEFWQQAQDLDVPVCLQLRLGAATPQLESVLDRFPAVRVLLDHIGYPDIATSPAEAGRQVALLARHPGLHLKLTHRNLEPLHAAGPEALAFLLPVVEAFGADRIAWGSNYPAADQPLPELVQLALEVLAPLQEAVVAAILADTTRRLYPGLVRVSS